MVIVILKAGYTFGFEMSDFEKEKALVARFTSGGLSPTTSLDLKSKGTYKVEEIQNMEFCPVKVIKKEEKKEKKKRTDDRERLEKDLKEAIKKRGERSGRDEEFWKAYDSLKPKKP